MFNTPEYNKNKHIKLAHQWSPLIALYSGARLCQLHLEDVRKDDDVWVFDINANTSDKHFKSKASKRLIPIHPHLVELGFLEPVDRLKASGESRLFPEL